MAVERLLAKGARACVCQAKQDEYRRQGLHPNTPMMQTSLHENAEEQEGGNGADSGATYEEFFTAVGGSGEELEVIVIDASEDSSSSFGGGREASPLALPPSPPGHLLPSVVRL